MISTIVRRKLSRSIIAKDHILMLDFIRQKHSSNTQDEDMLIESAAANQIIVQKNDDIWYDINPLISNTVETYAANLTENDQ